MLGCGSLLAHAATGDRERRDRGLPTATPNGRRVSDLAMDSPGAGRSICLPCGTAGPGGICRAIEDGAERDRRAEEGSKTESRAPEGSAPSPGVCEKSDVGLRLVHAVSLLSLIARAACQE